MTRRPQPVRPGRRAAARGRRIALALVVAVVATACSPGGAEEAGPVATASPVPAATETPTDEATADPTVAPAPAPSAAPSPSPTAADAPSPSPSPTADATPAPTVDEEAALAAAAARRAQRPSCETEGIADDFDRVVLDLNEVLVVFVACFVGAYQANGELLAYDGVLRSWPVEQWVDGQVVELDEVVGDLTVAPDGALENLQRYRALGDCGLFQRWSVAGERLRLVEAREQPCVDDGLPVPPVEWPLVHGG